MCGMRVAGCGKTISYAMRYLECGGQTPLWLLAAVDHSSGVRAIA